MDAQRLREWTDWVLTQADQLAIADVAEDDARIGKAQQTAIALWKLGFTDHDRLSDIRDWLDASYMQPPYYTTNLENAASAIVAGRKPPARGKSGEVPTSIRNAYEMILEATDG
jgi:hypothetical protein